MENNDEIKVFSNPVTGEFYIDGWPADKNIQISLVNQTGRIFVDQFSQNQE